MGIGFYRAFEDRYRGSRELIKSRLQAYLPFLTPLALQYSGAQVLDLGCGRGEWLELATETGFRARGIDLDESMLAACRERGMDVQQAEALETLRNLPDASVAMVSAFHLVEHLPFDDIQALISEALRVLLPGGLLILETPNPENLVIGTTNFYFDPSHVKPLPSLLLDFVVEYSGFIRHKLIRLQEPARLQNAETPVALMDVLGSVSPDYAIIGQKDAEATVLAPFAAAFEQEYGLSLAMLAQRYEQQTATRDAELRQAKEHIEKLDQKLMELSSMLSVRVAAAEDLTEQFQRQLQQMQEKLASANQSELKVQELEQRISAIMSSSSWRVTAPARTAASFVYRLKSAAREGRIKSGLKRRAVTLIVGAEPGQGTAFRVINHIKRNERVRRVVLPLLLRFPFLRQRVQGILRLGQTEPLPVHGMTAPDWDGPLPEAFFDMPESARKILLDLARAKDKYPPHP